MVRASTTPYIQFPSSASRESRGRSAVRAVGIRRWITSYNHLRPQAAHGGPPRAVVYFNDIETDQQVQAAA